MGTRPKGQELPTDRAFWISHGIGQKPDGEVGKSAGCSGSHVYMMRQRLSIPAAQKQLVCEVCEAEFKVRYRHNNLSLCPRCRAIFERIYQNRYKADQRKVANQ